MLSAGTALCLAGLVVSGFYPSNDSLARGLLLVGCAMVILDSAHRILEAW